MFHKSWQDRKVLHVARGVGVGGLNTNFFHQVQKSVTSHKTLTRVSAGPQHELDGFAGLSPARPGPEKGEGRIAKTTIVFRKPGPSTCDHDATTIQTPKKTQELKQGNCSWPGTLQQNQ